MIGDDNEGGTHPIGPIYCEMGPDPEHGRIKFVKDKIILEGFQFSFRSGGECS